jgi:thiol-disulfide isomerase/thioredoxin
MLARHEKTRREETLRAQGMSGPRLPGGLWVGLMAVTALSSGTSGASPKSEPTPHPSKAARTTKVPAHGVTVLDATGLRQVMGKAKGGDLFIHLWASWCGPCLEELPDIDRLARQTRARGAAFLSVSLDDPRRAAHVLDVLHRQAPNLTRFVAKFDDPDKFAELFSGEWDGSIPALFVYDRTGHLRASFVGQLENADIRRMLADISPAPPGPPSR